MLTLHEAQFVRQHRAEEIHICFSKDEIQFINFGAAAMAAILDTMCLCSVMMLTPLHFTVVVIVAVAAASKVNGIQFFGCGIKTSQYV